jgi:hypothetical protein
MLSQQWVQLLDIITRRRIPEDRDLHHWPYRLPAINITVDFVRYVLNLLHFEIHF